MKISGLTAATVFSTPIADRAWKKKPVWSMVAKADHIISPNLERMYAGHAYARAHARKIVEIEGASHSVYRSHPREVADLIEAAARTASAR